ncbi:MAG TPA: hypothetical protein VIW25_01165 [Nitrososphaeraceae archaeon]
MEKSSTTDQRLQTMALKHYRVIVIRDMMISKITVPRSLISGPTAVLVISDIAVVSTNL